jgi:hypothetical protein
MSKIFTNTVLSHENYKGGEMEKKKEENDF